MSEEQKRQIRRDEHGRPFSGPECKHGIPYGTMYPCKVCMLPTSEVEPAAPATEEKCKWKENEDGWWETECDHAWEFNDGGPKENKAIYCPYCGKKIDAIRWKAPTDKREEKL